MKKLFLYTVIGCVLLSFFGCASDPVKITQPLLTTKPADETTEPIHDAESLDQLYADMLEDISNTEPNSSSRVDAIALFAKKAAKAGNENIGNEAVLFIANTYPNYYTSNEIMEKSMLCGYYLEYLNYGDRVTQLGQDTEQAVKYVYRGTETTESDATRLNLEQLWEIIETSSLE